MTEKIETPTILVIFGVTGDLSRRKLLPAIFDLYTKGFLPKNFRVVGFSRGQRTDTEFHNFITEVIGRKKHGHSKKVIGAFLENTHYVCGRFEEPEHYEELAKKLITIDNELGRCSNKLFYLAVPPTFYHTIFQNLADSGLSIPCGGAEGWTRILVEKPFGKDLETAQKLDQTLGLLFQEEQIFRIDHYLAKETLQNILTFRFSNKLFEPIWNNQHIEKVEIKLWETLGMEGRGAFYEDVGALRDVGQNHLLQMLAFVAMENPGELAAGPIRDKRAQALRALTLIPPSSLSTQTVRGQYAGYRREKNVAPDSSVETYFRIYAHIDNARWRGVPFYLESGKKLSEEKTEISVYFKESTTCLCRPDAKQHHQNVLVFRIQPDEGISILFWAKKPGFATDLEPKKLSFKYKDSPDVARLPDAYERILFDCIRGDQILFTSTDEVTASWKFITPILDNWNDTRLHIYEQGSEGPKHLTI
jgi:glucose-6-phosphate 1-dehydrogenase